MSLLVSGIQSLRAALPGNGPPLPGLLRSGFGDGMRAMTMQTASQLFPNVDFAPPRAAAAGPGGGTPAVATGTGMPRGGGLQLPIPGGQTLTLPAPPGFASAPNAGATGQTGFGPGAGGLLQTPGGMTLPAPPIQGTPGNAAGFNGGPAAPVFPGTPMSTPAPGGLIGSTLGMVRALLAPTATPPAPTMPGGGQTATGAGMTAVPAAIATGVTVPIRVLATALPQPAVSTAAGQAVTASLMAPGTPAMPLATVMTQPGVGAQQAAQPLPLAGQAPPTSTPLATATTAPSMPAAGAPPNALPTASGLPQATAVAAPAARADVPSVVGPQVADRPAAMPPSQAAMPPTVPGPPAGASLLAAAPLVAAMQTPAGQQVPGNPQLAGNPQATAPVAGTIGGPSRAELTPTGVYTAEGPGLRRRERMRVGPKEIGAWMLALREGRLHLVRPHDDATPREVARVFQWLFWVLALVAYGSLALVLGSFLLSFGELPSAPTMRRWTGEFALAGLVAAGGAWWLARRLAPPDRRAQGTPPPP